MRWPRSPLPCARILPLKGQGDAAASAASPGLPSERLSIIALQNRERILARNNAIIDENLPKWEAFFDCHTDLFEWRRPDGSCMAYPRYLGPNGVASWTQSLVEEAGVLLLPSTIYRSELGPTPTDRFRLGLGRRGLDEGLAAMETHLTRAG